MSKIAFLYPGQGAQVAGMGKDFYEKSPLAKEVFDKSCEILGQDMKHICFEENELLDRTDYTQAALVTTCMAMTKEIMARGLTPDMTAGLSLGEYCAITTFHLLKRSRGEALSGTFRSDIRRVKDSLCDKCGCKYRDRYDKNKRIIKRTGLFLRFMGAECACHDSRRCGRFRRNRSGKDFERFYEKD